MKKWQYKNYDRESIHVQSLLNNTSSTCINWFAIIKSQVWSLQFNSIHFNSVYHFNSIPFTSIDFNWLQLTSLNSLHFIWLQYTSIQFNSLQFNSFHCENETFSNFQLFLLYYYFLQPFSKTTFSFYSYPQKFFIEFEWKRKLIEKL